MKKISRGFGLLEAVVAVAVIAVMSTVGYSTYQNHVVRTQEEVAKHDMLQIMGDFQKQYVKTGAYSDKNGQYSQTIINQVSTYNEKSKYFNFKLFPDGVANAHQHVCIVSSPKPDTMISNKVSSFSVDNYGKVYYGNMPDACNGFDPNEDDPKPSCKWETTFEQDKDCYCSFIKRQEEDARCKPEPEPASCTESTPFEKDEACYCSIGDRKTTDAKCKEEPEPQQCTDKTTFEQDKDCFCKFNPKSSKCNPYPPGPGGKCADMQAESPISWFAGDSQCSVDKYTFFGSGSCQGKSVLGGCSGNCDRTKNYVISGVPVSGNIQDSVIMYPISKPGQSAGGNMDRTTICNATCSGNCHDVTIVAGPNTDYPLCSGNCDRVTVVASGKSPKAVISCNGNCRGSSIHIPKSWGNMTLKQLCNGNCEGISITHYDENY